MASTARMTLVASMLLLTTNHVIPHEDVKKTSEDALDWWETAVFYQVYTRSFKDSDGDGIGDLQGITENLDYLSDLGVSAVCLAPIFSSPMVDFGYDIDNYIDIDPIFGTLKDFERLVEKAKRLGIKVILDFVPNHTSKQHEWFLKSRQREEPYTDYYVWRDSPGRSTSIRPPNNWLSVFGGSAWTWDNVRGQYFLHQFTEDQPDLNFRCPAVRQEMKEVLRFWLGRGAFGFRVDAVSHLFEDSQFRDEPESVLDAEDWEYTFLEHPLTRDLSQNYWLVQEWRQVLDEFASGVDNVTRVIMTESYSDIKDTMGYYGSSEIPGVHFPLNFLFITKLNNFCEAEEIKNVIKLWMTKLPENKSANWVLGNHDVPRVAARFGPPLVDAFNMLLMVLPGVAVTYNGEEIGMEDTFISWEQTKDPNGLYVGSRRYTKFSRDPQRTPFQWDTSTSAGFSRNTSTWLPVNDNYMKLNLQSQTLAKESHYHVYKRLVQARRSASLQKGDVDIQLVSKYVLTIFRLLEGHETFVAIINFGDNEEKINITEITKIAGAPGHIQVHTGSVHSGFSQGAKISPGVLTLNPYAAVLIVIPAVKSEKREQHEEVEDQAEQIEKMVLPEMDIDNESMEGDVLDLTEEDEAFNSTLISTDTSYNAKTNPDSGDLATDTSEALFSTTDAIDETVTDNEELDTTAMVSQDSNDVPATTLKTTRTTNSTDVGKYSSTSKSPSSAYSGISLILNVTSSTQVDSNLFNTLNAISKSDESSSESVEATDEGSYASVSIPDMSSNANESEELSDIIEDFNGGGVVAEAMTTQTSMAAGEKLSYPTLFACLVLLVTRN